MMADDEATISRLRLTVSSTKKKKEKNNTLFTRGAYDFIATKRAMSYHIQKSMVMAALEVAFCRELGRGKESKGKAISYIHGPAHHHHELAYVFTYIHTYIHIENERAMLCVRVQQVLPIPVALSAMSPASSQVEIPLQDLRMRNRRGMTVHAHVYMYVYIGEIIQNSFEHMNVISSYSTY